MIPELRGLEQSKKDGSERSPAAYAIFRNVAPIY